MATNTISIFSSNELREQLAAAKLECTRLREENMRLKFALGLETGNGSQDIDNIPMEEEESEITGQSAEELKIALFKGLL